MSNDANRHSYKYLSPQEENLSKQFLENGYVIVESEETALLHKLQRRVANSAADHLNIVQPSDCLKFLNAIHQNLKIEQLNDLRLAIINNLRNDTDWFKETYFLLAKNALSTLIGSELAMQRSVGLSVQLPQDDSSLLPIHSDVWDGDSPFEVVMWLPLVDCYKTKSMYLLEFDDDRKAQEKINAPDAESLFKSIEDKAKFIDIKYGQVLLFSQTLLHGNRINESDETRWSMNCRFKSLMSPYNDKKLIETFEPVTLKAATRIGLNYKLPKLEG